MSIQYASLFSLHQPQQRGLISIVFSLMLTATNWVTINYRESIAMLALEAS